MLVALMALDKDGAAEVRKTNREGHIAYLKASGDTVFMAGPMLDDAGGMIGSLIVLEVADMDAARAWADADPYAKAGLFQQVYLNPWNKVIG